jgi:hypothetical protein
LQPLVQVRALAVKIRFADRLNDRRSVVLGGLGDQCVDALVCLVVGLLNRLRLRNGYERSVDLPNRAVDRRQCLIHW